MKLLSSFTFKNKNGYLYRKNGMLYYSSILLNEETDNTKFLTYIEPNIKLSDFLLTL